MQKKLMAIAVAGALGAPAVALAQASTVQIYGKVNAEYAYIDEGGTRNSFDRVFNPGSSAIGFRGEEKLGRGLSAWFQCESEFNIQGTGLPLCRRNSAVGFKHSAFGNIFIGNWDMPYKVASGATYRPFDTTGFLGVGSILHNETTTTDNTSNTTSFHRRQNNSIHYHSPVWQGLQVMVGVSARNEVSGTVDGIGAGPLGGAEPRVISVAATYRNGPLVIGGGYERHNDFRALAGAPAGTFGDDEGWNVNVGYTFFGVLRLGAIYERLEYETGAPGNPGAELKRNAAGVYGAWQIQGPHNLRVGFTWADDSSGGGTALNNIGSDVPGAVVTKQGSLVAVPAGNNGAKQYSIEYAYQFSKRTEVGVGYTYLDNDDAGLYRLNGATRATGRDTRAVGVTIRHSF